MAPIWKRTVFAAIPLAVALSMALPQSAAAATDPCKTNAKSTACKAERAKASGSSAKTSSTPAKSSASGTAKPTAKAAAPARKAEARPEPKATAKAEPAARTMASKTVVVARRETVVRKGALPKTRVVSHERAASVRHAAVAEAALRPGAGGGNALRSSVAYVQDLDTSTVLYSKNESEVRPIASISKLLTALVVVDAGQPMDEVLEVTDDDVDRLKHASSRLPVGTRLNRADMLHVALMSSENRAAHALGRYYPGGMPAFVQAMNDKARSLGMLDSHFVEPTGLSYENVSSPRDLVRLLRAASQRPLIHRYTTDTEYDVEMRGRMVTFRNTNALVRNPDWDIKVSKTGFINEAGECLVMLARIEGRDLAIVLLDSQGKYSRIGDAVRIRKIVQSEVAMM
jgi:D-alanyl-D-alanine endopeptidase (penicillin-binding protein 7)